MHIALVTLGGKIDTVASVMPAKKIDADRSQALHTLDFLMKRRRKRDTADHVIIGTHGTKHVGKAAFTSLANFIHAKHMIFDRIVVTSPSEQIESIAFTLASHIFKVNCPVIVTGAELPNEKDLAGNAIANLQLAAFSHAAAFPGFYHAEGETFEAAHPRQTRFQRSHPVRNLLFWRPTYPPLGKPTKQPNRDVFDC